VLEKKEKQLVYYPRETMKTSQESKETIP